MLYLKTSHVELYFIIALQQQIKQLLLRLHSSLIKISRQNSKSNLKLKSEGYKPYRLSIFKSTNRAYIICIRQVTCYFKTASDVYASHVSGGCARRGGEAGR